MYRVLFEHPYISSYSFSLFLGFLLGFFLARWNARRVGIAGRHVDNIVLLLVVTGLMGARIFSYWFYFPPGIGFWRALFFPGGGLVFYGGVVFGFVTTVAYAFIMRIPLRTMLDLLAGPLALGLMLGRVGCFMAGCCWGDLCVDRGVVPASVAYKVQTFPSISPANFPLAVRYPADAGAVEQHHKLGLIGHDADRSLPVHPVQLYEALLVLGLLVWTQRRFLRQKRPGEATMLLFAGYGVVRFAMEFLRADNTPAYWGLTISQVISMVMIAGSAAYLLATRPPVEAPAAASAPSALPS